MWYSGRGASQTNQELDWYHSVDEFGDSTMRGAHLHCPSSFQLYCSTGPNTICVHFYHLFNFKTIYLMDTSNKLPLVFHRIDYRTDSDILFNTQADTFPFLSYQAVIVKTIGCCWMVQMINMLSTYYLYPTPASTSAPLMAIATTLYIR